MVDADVERVLIRATLRALVRDLRDNYACRCGEEPFTDGNECPTCFGALMCAVLEIDLIERKDDSA